MFLDRWIMPHDIRCRACGNSFRLPLWFDGREVTCPDCADNFRADFLGDREILDVIPVAPPPNGVRTTPPLPRPPRRPLPVDRDDDERPVRSAFSPSDPKRRSRLIWTIGFIGLLVLVALFTVGQISKSRNDRSATPEDEVARRAEIQRAFRDQTPLAEAEMAAELKPVFDRLGAALTANDGNAAADHFDFDRFMEEFESLGMCPPEVKRDRSGFKKGMRIGMSRAFGQKGQLFHWIRTDIRGIRRLQGNEAVVLARHGDDDSSNMKVRWWVSKQSGTWKVYDFEELNVGMRATALMGSGIAQAIEWPTNV